MEPDRKPSKQQVRDWLRRRRMLAMPLPDLAVLRGEIGWQVKRASTGGQGNTANVSARHAVADPGPDTALRKKREALLSGVEEARR